MISVITPSYNQANFIQTNIESVIQCCPSAVEHIIIDGGSTDGTVKIIKSYEDEYNLRWVSEPDEGQSHAINKGISMAEGDWIGWQNADDYYLPDALHTLQEHVEEDLDVIYGDQLFVNRRGNEIDRRYHTTASKFIQKHWMHFTANSCMIIRRSVFDKIGRVRSEFEYTMDAELFWRLLMADLNYKHVPKFLGVRRLHDEAKTTGDEYRKTEQYRWEAEHLYEYSTIERQVPDILFKIIAFGLKTGYLTFETRFEGISHMIKRVLQSRT